MNSNLKNIENSIESIDKTIKLTNKYTLDKLEIILKTDSEKVTAAKFNGDIDLLNFLNPKYEQISWKSGLNYLFDKYILYQNHIQFAYVNTIENLIGNQLNITDRANSIRTIILELERISSHLELLAEIMKAISFPLLYSRILQINQQVVLILDKLNETEIKQPNITIGGVSSDINKTKEKILQELIENLEKSIKRIKLKIKNAPVIKEILKETGFISRETAKKLSLTGPIARSSGITYDIRKADPYASYSNVAFTIPVYDTCDIYGEIMVRLDEILESKRIIKQLLENLSSEPVNSQLQEISTINNNTITRVESPFGELFIFAMSENGTLKNKPKVFKLFSPIKTNSQGLLARLSGEVIENSSLILTVFGNGWR